MPIFADSPMAIRIVSMRMHCGVNTGPNIAESANFMTWNQDLWNVYDSAAMHLLRARNVSNCLICEDHWYFDVKIGSKSLRQ